MANLAYDELYAAGRLVWPTIELPAAAFAACVARLAGPFAVEQAGDAYLCCACALGHGTALREFEARYFAGIDRAVARMKLHGDDIDDVRQLVREKLFLSKGADGLPRIADYAGHGDLALLVRVIATRAALNLLRTRRRRHEVSEEDALLFAVDERDDPELAVLKERLRRGFKQAFASAVAALPDRQRTMLRLHLVDDLTIDDLAVLYHVHRATAARRLAAAKEALTRASLVELQQQLGLSGDGLASARRLVQSQIDLSLSRLLREA